MPSLLSACCCNAAQHESSRTSPQAKARRDPIAPRLTQLLLEYYLSTTVLVLWVPGVCLGGKITLLQHSSNEGEACGKHLRTCTRRTASHYYTTMWNTTQLICLICRTLSTGFVICAATITHGFDILTLHYSFEIASRN